MLAHLPQFLSPFRVTTIAALCAATIVLVSPPASALPCSGDCNADGHLTVDELVRAVSIALGELPFEVCPSIDISEDGSVTVEEIIIATQYALSGCPPADTPTPTLPATSTASNTPAITSSPTETATSTATATETATPTLTATPTGNRPPELACQNVYRTFPGFPIERQIPARDPSDDAITFVPGDLPEGASLDESGVFTWTPGDLQLGPFYHRFMAMDDGEPPMSAEGELIFKVSPLDSCTVPTCSPGTGCTTELLPLAETCCQESGGRRVAEPLAGCPQGRVVFVGRPGGPNFQRVKNCDALPYVANYQLGAFVFFDLQARCLRTDRDILLSVRMETATRLMFDEDRLVQFDPDANDFFTVTDLLYEVGGGGPFFDLDNSEANLSVTLTDADGAAVSTQVRLLPRMDALTILPDVDSQMIPPEPGPCNGVVP